MPDLRRNNLHGLQLMARLLPLLLLAGVGIFLAIAAQRNSGTRDSRAYRPRRSYGSWFDRSTDKRRGTEPFVVTVAELEGLRDGYSGAELDHTRPLVRCSQCLAFYQADSAEVLIRENAGRCAGCGGKDFRAVTVTGA